MGGYIRVYSQGGYYSDFYKLWRACVSAREQLNKVPDREQARSLLEKPVNTENLKIITNEELNEQPKTV